MRQIASITIDVNGFILTTTTTPSKKQFYITCLTPDGSEVASFQAPNVLAADAITAAVLAEFIGETATAMRPIVSRIFSLLGVDVLQVATIKPRLLGDN